MGDFYLWVKAVHVIAIIAWMAGMLYLPRLFVYHAAAAVATDTSETFKVMERRLLRAITTPAMIVSLISGAWLILMVPEHLSEGWLHAKIALVIAMVAAHGLLARHRRLFADDQNRQSARYFRILNEVPTVLLIGIIILVIVRPF